MLLGFCEARQIYAIYVQMTHIILTSRGSVISIIERDCTPITLPSSRSNSHAGTFAGRLVGWHMHQLSPSERQASHTSSPPPYSLSPLGVIIYSRHIRARFRNAPRRCSLVNVTEYISQKKPRNICGCSTAGPKKILRQYQNSPQKKRSKI